jgi:uncharacterized protein (DUF488 family)
MKSSVFTVGHSNHPLELFIELLRRHGVTALADVRSLPYSRKNPQFNREDLKEALTIAGITYVFLGKELGARSDDPTCYEHGKVRYDRLARTDLFKRGVQRIQEASEKFRLALMCAERDPLNCHRTILVAKHLVDQNCDIKHIHADGAVESHGDAIDRLIQMLKLPTAGMFHSQDDIVEDAYKKQAERIAYAITPANARVQVTSTVQRFQK